jgi:serine/threonine-protein kinase
MVGDVLDGRYEIQAVVSSGGMATVYRGLDRRLGRIVAIKLMREGLGDDVDYVSTFDREARTLSALSDPHIVSVFDQGEDRGRPFIVMEFVEGWTLRQVIKQQAPLAPARAINFMESVAAGLATAHDAGLIHRDVKPENVLISNKGQIKVADFGLARSQSNHTLTVRQGVLLGSVGYLPPERVSENTADKRSDVYSAGIMLFEMLTGKKPYTGETELETAWMHVHNTVPAPSTLVSETVIPAYIDELVLSATSRNPDERPADGRELLRRVRIARRALTAGIPDDAELTHAMNPTGTVSPKLGATGSTGDLSLDAAAVAELAAAQASPAGAREDTPQLLIGHDGRKVKAKRAGAMRLSGFSNEKKYRQRRVVVATAVVLLLAVGLGIVTWWLVSGRYTDMPDLRNQSRADAELLAAQTSITLKFEDAYSEDVPAGLVITTEPAPLDKIRRDGEAKVFLSIGPERFEVPKLVGSTVESARATLQALHLELGTVSQGYSDDQPLGTIIEQSVAEGELVRRNTSIGVTVSQGRKPIPITDYTGQSAEVAVSELKAAGLEVTISDAYSDTIEPGTVMQQEPNSGDLYKGDTVKLTVSKGPELVAVPSGLTWTSAANAQAILEAANLKSEIRHGFAYVGLNVVTEVSPPSGTLVEQGYTVILYVK